MPANDHPNILVFETPEQVALAAAERFVVHARESISDHGLFSVALSGGTTPKRMYEHLASESFRAIDWSRVHIFFGDERTVPSDHLDSNYRLANDTLISRVSIPPDNVHPMIGVGDAVENAHLYERELKSFFSGAVRPRFDLVLLGIGGDGHTASLFPGTVALKEELGWVFANWVEGLAGYRITLTATAINAAANVEFLVTGANKAPALAAILNGPQDPERLPAQLIKPDSGSLTWLVDAQAASKLGM